MSRTQMIMAAVVACGLLTASSEAMAQRPNRSGSRPSLNPYQSLFRGDNSYMDPYRSLMRPYQSPSERVRREPTTSLDRTATSLNRTANLPRSPEMMRMRGQTQQQLPAVQIAPTGSGSGFMNLSHFYPAGRARR